jgi:hypothetical protein
MTYNGIPILDAGKKADGTPVIPQTETQGTATGTTSSIYAVHYSDTLEDQGVCGLTNGGCRSTRRVSWRPSPLGAPASSGTRASRCSARSPLPA